MARKTISKKLRFEVFKRDSFTCQYCGRMAPDVVLEIDHINPVVNGGDNDIMNLITSCFDCNRGKGKKKLTEKDEIKKQQEQLKELNSKREQLKMMLDWRKELENFEDEQLKEFLKDYEDKTGFTLTEHGSAKVKKWIKEFGLIEVIDCMKISISQYFDIDDRESTIKKTFDYIPKICNVRKKQKDNPLIAKQIAKQNYIRAILRNRLSYFNEYQFKIMVKNLHEEDYDELKDIATTCRHWSDFKDMFEAAFESE